MDSLLAQTVEDYEVVLVDDGSTDGSGSICDEYARENDRVHVIHQENAGLSAARLAGIRASCGAYLGFVDSDDYVEPDMYERLLAPVRQDAAIEISISGHVVDSMMVRSSIRVLLSIPYRGMMAWKPWRRCLPIGNSHGVFVTKFMLDVS